MNSSETGLLRGAHLFSDSTMTSNGVMTPFNVTERTDLSLGIANTSHKTQPAIVAASDTSYSCVVLDFVFLSVFQGLLVFFGLIGNTLSMFVFWMTSPQTSTSLLLIWLAAYDNLALVFYYLMTGVNPICIFYQVCQYFSNTVLATLAAYVWTIATIGNMGGTFVVLTLAYHRYIGACHPHHVARLANIRIARYQLAAILVFVITFNFPRFIDNYPYQEENSTQAIVKSTALGDDFYYQLVYGGIVYYIVAFAIPFLLLTFMTYKLIGSLKMFYVKREQMNRVKHDENAVNKTLVVIVVVFMTCQSMNPIRRIISTIWPHVNICHLSIITTIAITAEASLHFLLYCMFDRRFLRQLKQRTGGPSTMVTPVG